MTRKFLLVATLFLCPALSVALGPGVASADHPSACHDDTTLPHTYTHGAPQTGLPSRHGYYYLEVKFGIGPDGKRCGVGKDGLVHLIGHVHALKILPAVGDVVHGYVPTKSRHAMYWLEFHGYASTGKQFALLGGSGRDGSQHVTTPDHVDRGCRPSGKTLEVCQDGPGTSRLTLRYDGPDVFGLKEGRDARFRIANESGLTITDFAQLDVVPCSTSGAP